MLAGKLLSFLASYGTLGLKIAVKLSVLCMGQTLIRFVADEHDDHIGIGVLTSVVQPRSEVVEGVSPGQQ